MHQLLPLAPCYTAQLFRPLHAELLTLLKSLDAADWQRQTVAPRWKVCDIVAHLLDVDLRRIAVYRDGHFATAAKPPVTEREVADLVNRLNAEGVAFGSHLSSRLLTDLHAITGVWVAGHTETLDPDGKAIFAVSWAGEAESRNWMDIGREYTERWHHQMQIRDATGRPLLLLEPHWMLPLLDISVRALPHAYRSITATAGTAVAFRVTGDTRAAWTLVRVDAGWAVLSGESGHATTTVECDANAVWRLLYNAPFDRGQVRVEGDAALAAPLLNTRSVVV
jgi:hypothetical protein